MKQVEVSTEQTFSEARLGDCRKPSRRIDRDRDASRTQLWRSTGCPTERGTSCVLGGMARRETGSDNLIPHPVPAGRETVHTVQTHITKLVSLHVGKPRVVPPPDEDVLAMRADSCGVPNAEAARAHGGRFGSRREHQPPLDALSGRNEHKARLCPTHENAAAQSCRNASRDRGDGDTVSRRLDAHPPSAHQRIPLGHSRGVAFADEDSIQGHGSVRNRSKARLQKEGKAGLQASQTANPAEFDGVFILPVLASLVCVMVLGILLLPSMQQLLPIALLPVLAMFGAATFYIVSKWRRHNDANRLREDNDSLLQLLRELVKENEKLASSSHPRAVDKKIQKRTQIVKSSVL